MKKTKPASSQRCCRCSERATWRTNHLANYEAYAEKLKAAKKFMKHTLNYINERLPR